MLQPDEISRAERYHRTEDRQRFIYARGWLRVLTGRYTGQVPKQVRFTKDANNKPALLGNTDWHVNVSHSGNWILLAVGKVSLGVDVEQIQTSFSFNDILPASFSQAEQAYVKADTDSRRRFYQVWTRKEALIKATGKGMDDDFSQVPALDGLHRTESRIIGGTGDWQVAGFVVSADYMGAVAYQATVETPKFYTLESGLFTD
ncbi:4'-phosphopantetheinyl transferase superfamily protein [Spirosoma horti]